MKEKDDIKKSNDAKEDPIQNKHKNDIFILNKNLTFLLEKKNNI